MQKVKDEVNEVSVSMDGYVVFRYLTPLSGKDLRRQFDSAGEIFYEEASERGAVDLGGNNAFDSENMRIRSVKRCAGAIPDGKVSIGDRLFDAPPLTVRMRVTEKVIMSKVVEVPFDEDDQAMVVAAREKAYKSLPDYKGWTLDGSDGPDITREE